MPVSEDDSHIQARITDALRNPHLIYAPRPTRHVKGACLRYTVKTLSPAVEANAVLRVNAFLGGGFAGQVYRCTLEELTGASPVPVPDLTVGRTYAVKILLPATGFAHRFRDFVFWLAFQGPFSAQISEDASRAGLLMQKVIRCAAGAVFGRDRAVKDAYASFWDPDLGSYGEITEWVEGRSWRLEADDALAIRRRWRTITPAESPSREYVATRQFMNTMVHLLHDLGAHEFARQYEWWTMKSQPNTMIRTDLPDHVPENCFCAIDFRAGLALLPFLPMSPADIRLILEGLFRRGSLVQFDRHDLSRLDAYVAAHPETFAGMEDLISELHRTDEAYRRSLPDLSHHLPRLLFDRELRRSVREGLIAGYCADEQADPAMAQRLRGKTFCFVLFCLLGLIPVIGARLRRIWGNRRYRAHLWKAQTNGPYMWEVLSARNAVALETWLRSGRVSSAHARFVMTHPIPGAIERFTLGMIPFAAVHRCLLEPSILWQRMRQFGHFARQFWSNEKYREEWFLGEIEDGRRSGMLHDDEARAIATRVRDPFIKKYLTCLAVHFATIPVTQIVSVIAGIWVAAVILARGNSWQMALMAFGGIVAAFQAIPISPGSICRGSFVVYLMIRERNWRDYLIACPLSFVKYIGYLAFPLQMTTAYPELARFLCARWATRMVHLIPVFGEKGALLEHWAFDLSLNIPRAIARWAGPRLGILFTCWALVGTVAVTALVKGLSLDPAGAYGINALLAYVCVFLLPRLVFLPLLNRPGAPPTRN